MSTIPIALLDAVRLALTELSGYSPIQTLGQISGGCINHAHRLDTERNSYLLKWNATFLPGMFEAEAEGLKLIRATEKIRVPQVYWVNERTEHHPAFILMEWLEPNQNRHEEDDQVALGAGLALMHREGFSPHQPPAYGLATNNYLGASPQVNGWDEDWITFFRDRRLGEQLRMAQQAERLPAARQRLLEQLMGRLDNFLGGVVRQPSLLHGDLWSGNAIPGPDGLALIDPAVYYGDREAELAYTQLFGGFDRVFYKAYEDVWPLEPGFSERRDLYNLYHLLNHLNLFGESYGSMVDAVLQAYA